MKCKAASSHKGKPMPASKAATLCREGLWLLPFLLIIDTFFLKDGVISAVDYSNPSITCYPTFSIEVLRRILAE